MGDMGVPSGWVYFFGDLTKGRVVKVGWTSDWRVRLASLRRGYPFSLTPLLVIPGTPHDEAVILFRFRRFRTRGEWFRSTRHMLGFIDHLAGRPSAIKFPHRFSHLLGRPNQLEPANAEATAREERALARSHHVVGDRRFRSRWVAEEGPDEPPDSP